jgi:pPIWI_RE module N-terminal domain/RNaseH domain of pPIWI_RE
MVSKSNTIQLFALQVPNQISLPFDLYALAVPQHWKELFNRLQQHKLGKNQVLPPVECFNQVLQLLLDGILFSSPNAFRLKSTANWLYFNADKIDTAYIATAVKTWLNVSFENCNFLTADDIAKIHAISGSDLQIEKVQLPTPIWEIKDASIKVDSLYYDLIPYLLASEVARSPLALINLRTNEEFEKVKFCEIVSVESGTKEVISWPPMLAVKTRKKKDSEEKETITHYYSYFLKFVLHYSTGGEPYIICDCGIKRWVSWEFTYLRSGATVCIKPTKSTRFAACKLKYMGKEKGIDFESNLARLVKELNFRDKFTAQDVIQIPCKNDELACKNDGLVWAVTYSNTMSRSHNTDVGWFPIDHEIFIQACLKRFGNVFEGGFSLIETYSRCENRKALTKVASEYKNVEKFIKSHFAEKPLTPPFYIPPNLKLVLLVQDTPSEQLIFPLAKKYCISNVVVRELGSLGAELLGNSWSSNCSSRIKEFQKRLSPSPENTKTVTLIEILPKDHFWRDASKDPKHCFRPALAMLGSVTDHFEPKDEKDTSDFLTTEDLNSELMQRETAKQEGKTSKAKSLKSEFAYRLEATLLSGLSMAGAYVYPHFDADKFPQDVASIGVYVIPYYQGEKTKYLPVAVRMDKTGVTAKAYGFNEWLDFHTFQVKMASGSKDFNPFDFNKNNIQSWVFNNLFAECKGPTLFCFDAANVRTKGLIFLQKKFWQKHLLARDTGENMGIDENLGTGKNMTFIPLSKYPHIRIAGIISPNTSEVPLYRVCDEGNKLAGHTAGVFYPSSQNTECGYYYLSNQRPESRSSGILQQSKLIPMAKTKGENMGELKKPKPHAQGYNPRGVFLNLTLQEGDCFSDWASFVQCLRLYGLIHYLGATSLPAPLHLAAGLDDYRPIQAIREP